MAAAPESRNPSPRTAAAPADASRRGADCGGVVPAAGESRRFGAPKLLMPFAGSTVLGSVVAALTAAGLAPIVVVAGANAEAIEASLAGAPAEMVRNPDPARGMVSSIRIGVAALPASLPRFAIALGDQPRIRAEDLARLLHQHRSSGKGIALPTYRGRRGHPVVFRADYREAILRLSDDRTLRDLIHAHRDECLEVVCDSDAYVRDIDTQEQYEDEFRRAQLQGQ